MMYFMILVLMLNENYIFKHPSNVILKINFEKYIIVIPIALYDKNLLLNFDLRDLTGLH